MPLKNEEERKRSWMTRHITVLPTIWNLTIRIHPEEANEMSPS